jgi:hypothetical protein
MPVLRRLVKAFDLSLDDAVRASSEGAVAFGRQLARPIVLRNATLTAS